MMAGSNPLALDLHHVLELGTGLWDDLRGARLFITGGTGFVGRWMLGSLLLANEAQELGARGVVLSRDPAKFAGEAPHLVQPGIVTLAEGDVRSFGFPEGEFTHALHLATETNLGLCERMPSLQFDTAVEGTRRVLEFAAAAGVRRLLYTSSGAVYGPQPPELRRVPEEATIAPPTENTGAAYAHGKRAAEFLCCAAHVETGIETTIARLFAFVGPLLPLDAGYAVGNFIGDALAHRQIAVSGDGTPVRSYLYAADLAWWLWTILLRGESSRPYNVGSDAEISIGDLAATVAEVLGGTDGVRIAGTPQPGVAPQRYVPDVSRAMSELGLRSTVSLEEGIRRTAEWHRRSRPEGTV